MKYIDIVGVKLGVNMNLIWCKKRPQKPRFVAIEVCDNCKKAKKCKSLIDYLIAIKYTPWFMSCYIFQRRFQELFYPIGEKEEESMILKSKKF